MVKQVWLSRSKEWIEANPNKGTMYKASIDAVNGKECDSLIKKTREAIKNKNISGTYIVLCTANNTAYVGQSINLGTRLRQHKYQLSRKRAQKHSLAALKMIKDVERFGIESFTFKINEQITVEKGSSDVLIQKETELMHYLLSRGVKLYNTHIPYGNLFIYCPLHLQSEALAFIQSKMK